VAVATGELAFMRGDIVWHKKPRQMSESTIFFLHTQIKSEDFNISFTLNGFFTGFLRVLDGLISVPCFFLPLAQ
jgi:hypothetical protein